MVDCQELDLFGIVHPIPVRKDPINSVDNSSGFCISMKEGNVLVSLNPSNFAFLVPVSFFDLYLVVKRNLSLCKFLVEDLHLGLLIQLL